MVADTQPPILVSIGRDKATLDIDAAQTGLVITAVLTDDISGVSDGLDGTPTQIRFRSPSGQFVDCLFGTPSSGTTKNGTFLAPLTLPEFAEAGTWTVEYLLLADEAGNLTSLYPDTTPDLQALSFEVKNSNSDASPPSLVSIAINDPAIDINSGEKEQVVTATLSDDLSGLFDGVFADGNGGSPPQIRFISPTGQIIDGLFDIDPPFSGSRTDGVYKASLTFDSNAEAGVWKVQYLFLADEAGNMEFLYPETTPSLEALTFEIKNDTGDTKPPTVESVTFADPTLNPDGTSQFIVEAHLLDDISGLSDGINANGIGTSPPQIRFVSSTGQIVDGLFDIEHPISGTPVDGVFQATVVLSAFAETGTWTVEYLYLSDEAGNQKYYYPSTSPVIPPNTIVLGSDLPDTITGGGGAEFIYGFGGNDDLAGLAGDDTLAGGDGDDTVDGGSGEDTIIGGSGAGNDTYAGGAGKDLVVYTSATKKVVVDLKKGKAKGAEIGTDKLNGIENVLGGQAKDIVKGDNGKNTLDGYTGKDKLFGKGGKDAFVFSTELEKNNVDTIKDFKPKADAIHLDSAVFSGLTEGALKAKAFKIGKHATDKSDRVVYNKGEGDLIFDENGSKKGGAQVFAHIGDGLKITADDFLVI